MTRTIGDSTGDELDTRTSPVPSVVPAFVPDRVARRRQRLHALRAAEGPEPPEGPDAG
ncbi:MAG TPA: hypothetical protein VFU19_09205 [Iamia sp.]|nr:hypothetical protein [Iamia sp.]